jgi:hypothetical protein
MSSLVLRHVGYQPNEFVDAVFSQDANEAIREEVRARTGQLVSHQQVEDMVSSCFTNYRPTNISPFTRFTQLPVEDSVDPCVFIWTEACDTLSNQIRADLGMREEAKKLSRWTAKLDGTQGLLRHSAIKVRNKRPDPFQFHMKF